MPERPSRNFSPFYEKIVPVFLWVMGGITLLVVLATLLVALGIFPGMR